MVWHCDIVIIVWHCLTSTIIETTQHRHFAYIAPHIAVLRNTSEQKYDCDLAVKHEIQFKVMFLFNSDSDNVYCSWLVYYINITKIKCHPFWGECSNSNTYTLLSNKPLEPSLWTRSLFNLELHLSSPAPGPTNVTVLLFAFTIFTVFPTWTVLPASPSYRLVLGLQVNTELHCHCCFPQLFQQWSFHVNIYTSYEHWAMCRRWTGSIVCCVCRLMFVGYFVSWRRTITTNWLEPN